MHPFVQVSFLQTVDLVGIAQLGYLARMARAYQNRGPRSTSGSPGHSCRGTGIILSGCEQPCLVIKPLYASYSLIKGMLWVMTRSHSGIKKSKHPCCADSNTFWYAYCIINILTDASIFTSPIREVIKLQLPRRENFGLTPFFSWGYCQSLCKDTKPDSS